MNKSQRYQTTKNEGLHEKWMDIRTTRFTVFERTAGEKKKPGVRGGKEFAAQNQ